MEKLLKYFFVIALLFNLSANGLTKADKIKYDQNIAVKINDFMTKKEKASILTEFESDKFCVKVYYDLLSIRLKIFNHHYNNGICKDLMFKQIFNQILSNEEADWLNRLHLIILSAQLDYLCGEYQEIYHRLSDKDGLSLPAELSDKRDKLLASYVNRN